MRECIQIFSLKSHTRKSIQHKLQMCSFAFTHVTENNTKRTHPTRTINMNHSQEGMTNGQGQGHADNKFCFFPANQAITQQQMLYIHISTSAFIVLVRSVGWSMIRARFSGGCARQIIIIYEPKSTYTAISYGIYYIVYPPLARASS